MCDKLCHHRCGGFQGFPKVIKSCSHFSKTLLTTADIKAGCIGNKKIGYSVQGLVAKVKDTVVNGLFG